MKIMAFVWYYAKLRAALALKVRYTSNPTGIRWRWQHWNKLEESKERQKSRGRRRASAAEDL